jgi:hypothetical protein
MVITDDFGCRNMVVTDDFGCRNMVVTDDFGCRNMVVSYDFGCRNMVISYDFGCRNMVVTYDILTTQRSSLGCKSSLSFSESSQSCKFQSRKSPKFLKSSLRRNFIANMSYFFASCLSCRSKNLDGLAIVRRSGHRPLVWLSSVIQWTRSMWKSRARSVFFVRDLLIFREPHAHNIFVGPGFDSLPL